MIVMPSMSAPVRARPPEFVAALGWTSGTTVAEGVVPLDICVVQPV